jgi:hypothetical protein
MAQVSLPTLKLHMVLTTTSAVHLFSDYRLQLKLQNWMVTVYSNSSRESIRAANFDQHEVLSSSNIQVSVKSTSMSGALKVQAAHHRPKKMFSCRCVLESI